MDIKKYFSELSKSQWLFFIAVFLMIIYYVAIPLFYHYLLILNCDERMINGMLTNYRFEDTIVSIILFIPSFLSNIIFFSLFIVFVRLIKKIDLDVEVFPNIAVLSLLPALFLFNTSGFIIYKNELINNLVCDSNYRGLYNHRDLLIHYGLSVLIMFVTSSFYIRNALFKKGSWKEKDFIFIEIIICILISLLFPIVIHHRID